MGWFSRDLILLHAPSVFDFRESAGFFGPVSDVVPSSPVFEMYPIGLTTIAQRLEDEGFNVRIINIAYRMLKDATYDVEAEIARLKPRLFGIDLHWLPHAHGAIELARLVKRLHPDIPIVMGGLSASYYQRELIEYPCVDLVMRGDSTEEPMLELMKVLRFGGSLENVPNLTWKMPDGSVVENGLTHVPAHIDDISLPNYHYVIRSVFKYGSLANVIPYLDWLNYPITALLTSRGCTQNCAICGGGRNAYRQICNRPWPAFRSPEALTRDILRIQEFSQAPIILLNDVRQGGKAYAHRLLELLARAHIENELILELFFPVRDDFFERLARSVPRFSIEMTLESHREELRRINGKLPCSNQQIEETIRRALQNGAGRVDLFFMVGLPKQSYDDAVGCVDYCRSLLEKFDYDSRLWFFVAPLGPFLDPGSPAFEHPERFGYHKFCHSLEDHRRALTAPTWKHVLNYETDCMTRDQIVAATYDAAGRLAALKRDAGVITPDAYAQTMTRIRASQAVIAEVDQILTLPAGPERDRALAAARERHRSVQAQATCSKEELQWPIRRRFGRMPRLLWLGARLLAREAYILAFKRARLASYHGMRR
jgi:B12-binding domain/radical SAM domain protein